MAPLICRPAHYLSILNQIHCRVQVKRAGRSGCDLSFFRSWKPVGYITPRSPNTPNPIQHSLFLFFFLIAKLEVPLSPFCSVSDLIGAVFRGQNAGVPDYCIACDNYGLILWWSNGAECSTEKYTCSGPYTFRDECLEHRKSL